MTHPPKKQSKKALAACGQPETFAPGKISQKKYTRRTQDDNEIKNKKSSPAHMFGTAKKNKKILPKYTQGELPIIF